MFLIFDVGGTKIRYVVRGKEVIEQGTVKHKGKILHHLRDIIKEISSRYKLYGVAYSIAGQVLQHKVVRSPNISDIKDLNLKHFTLSLIPDIKYVVVENDANCFALSQYYMHKNIESLFGLIWGTGIGGGYIYKGEIIKGNHGLAGEIGHLTYIPNGKKCGCGRRGCYEAYLGGRYLDKIAQAKGREHLDYSSSYFYSLTHIPFKKLITSIALTFDPDIIVIGGGVGERIPKEYINRIKREVEEEIPFSFSLKLEKAKKGVDALDGCHYLLSKHLKI